MEKDLLIVGFTGLMKRLAHMFAVPIAAAFFVSVASAAADSNSLGLEDVQIGERDLQTRIALICDGPCTIEKRDDTSFFLHGVTSDMSLDLAERSRNIGGFKMTPDAEGSILVVQATRLIEYANAKPCVISDRAATCIDLFFADAAARSARLSTPSLTPQPVLREGAPDRLSRYAGLAPPERLTPPNSARLASVQPVSKSLATPIPDIRSERPLPQQSQAAKFDYAGHVKTLIGKTLSPGYCASAQARLQSDAWALDAMVDVGLCEAAFGNAEKAESILSRLLEYTPDNYEAHIGRALIALQAGEKSVARRYFQDALDAPPPIAESSRIVEAMKAL